VLTLKIDEIPCPPVERLPGNLRFFENIPDGCGEFACPRRQLLVFGLEVTESSRRFGIPRLELSEQQIFLGMVVEVGEAQEVVGNASDDIVVRPARTIESARVGVPMHQATGRYWRARPEARA